MLEWMFRVSRVHWSILIYFDAEELLIRSIW